MMLQAASERVNNIRKSLVSLKMPRALEMLDATLRRIEQGQIGGIEAIDEQLAEVERVLEEIGAEAVPQILVYNKCDLLDATNLPRAEADWIEAHPGVQRQRVFVSARTGDGLPRLRQAIAETAIAHLNAAGAAPPALLPDGTPVGHPAAH